MDDKTDTTDKCFLQVPGQHGSTSFMLSIAPSWPKLSDNKASNEYGEIDICQHSPYFNDDGLISYIKEKIVCILLNLNCQTLA